jgi:hypothetical protein
MHTYWIDKGFEKIGEEIYVYKNFLSQEEILKYKSLIDSHVENNLWEQGVVGSFFENKITKEIPEFQEIRLKAISLFEPDYKFGPSLSATCLRNGDEWGVHFDAHDFIKIREKSATLKDGDPYIMVDDSKYGTVIYFNEFEGGDLYYPEQNISYHPKPGEMVLHSSEEFCKHGVSKVISGPRYGFSGHLSQLIKFPIE